MADLRKIIEEAKQRRLSQHQKTILFIDEIHRFNKGQQDTILPYVEDGTVTLIGATTENPSFEVISPLLSRARTYVLKGLTGEQMKLILSRAIADNEHGIGNSNAVLSDEAAAQIVNLASGDARIALNILELAARTTPVDEAGKRQITLKPSRTPPRPRRCCTTGQGSSTTTSFLLYISLCAAPIRTLRCTGWDGCWRRGRTRCTSSAA